MNDRRRMLMTAQGGGGGRLPPAYQEVEWIGTQRDAYCVTTFVPNNNSGYKAKFAFMDTAQNGYIGGSLIVNQTRFLLPQRAGNATRIYYSVGSDSFNYNLLTAQWCTVEFNTDGERGITVDGVYQRNANTFSNGSAAPVYIFARNYNGANEKAYAKIAELILYDNSTPHEFVPCYHKSSGEIGFYDVFGQTFLPNAGTGTFTKGDDIL